MDTLQGGDAKGPARHSGTYTGPAHAAVLPEDQADAADGHDATGPYGATWTYGATGGSAYAGAKRAGATSRASARVSASTGDEERDTAGRRSGHL